MGPAGAAGRDAQRPRREPLNLAAWSEFLLPTRCLGCGELGPARDRSPVCAACRLRIPEVPRPRCPRCHEPGLSDTGPCQRCASWPSALACARSVAVFRGPVPALIHAFKYQGWTSLSPFLGARMARTVRLELSADLLDVVVPVPTTRRRLRERGFNPAGLLAEMVAAELKIPLSEALSRPGEGARQIGLPPSERAANVRGAFVPAGPRSGALNHQHVLLVDDVLTTGATGAEAARAAEACGARTVSLVTFARALPKDPDTWGHA